MNARNLTGLTALTAAALFAFAAPAFADTGAWEAVSSWPLARVLLAIASVAFTAALTRGAAR
jgi:hypothetical protein